MDNVPDYLGDLATWICQKCTNATPQAGRAVMVEHEEDDEPISRRTVVKRRREAA
jgi:hypothetical protein